MNPLRHLARALAFVTLVAVLAGLGCAAAPRLEAPVLEPLAPAPAPAPAPKVLERNVFERDRMHQVDEKSLREVLNAAVFLEDKARCGIVPVTDGYRPDTQVPVAPVTGALATVLDESRLFEVATEVSTEWPAERGISGLRELGTRYRTEYLLLFRHRFIDRSHTNHYAWLYLTFVGIFAAPSQTVETAGVLEATLFDVKTGTLLFTVFERVHAESNADVFSTDRAARSMAESLLAKAGENLADSVLHQTKRLAAAAPAATESTADATGAQ